MPTDLERRLLLTLIHEFNVEELRGLAMHIAEGHLEVVGSEALKMREERRMKENRHTGQALMESGVTTLRAPRELVVSESPVVESE